MPMSSRPMLEQGFPLCHRVLRSHAEFERSELWLGGTRDMRFSSQPKRRNPLVELESIIVREFDRRKLVGGNIWKDFMALIGVSGEGFASGSDANLSLDVAALRDAAAD